MQVYIGIDWSEQKHDVIFTNPAGAVIQQLVIAHTLEGFQKLDEARQRLGVEPQDCVIGIETAHNLLLDFLWLAGYRQIYILPPNVIRSSQGRVRQSGARSDRSDAWLIADVLRTDRHRYYPWTPGSPLLIQLRIQVAQHQHLTQSIQRSANRLRSVLIRYYPAALGVFSSLTTQISLAFIQAFPTPQQAAALDWEAFQTFARQRHVVARKLPASFAHLQRPQPSADPAVVLAYADQAKWLSEQLLCMVQAKAETERKLQALFQQHPDAFIYQSLPRAGDYLEPALLVKLGEDRQRFPTPSSLQALAGTCPITDKSGKRKKVLFRYACDHDFRNILQQWAKATLRESAWAVAYYEQVRPHSHSESHALRCLANRWLGIVWKLWQTSQAYDEGYHLRQRALRSQPRS